MSGLPKEFLEYPARRYGMDHDWYKWRNLFECPPVQWPDKKKVLLTLTVPLEWFPLDSTNQPFRPPGGMLTPYPDLRHYSSRDYGNRVAIMRMLELFDALEVPVTFAVNAALAERHPELIAALIESGRHELVAHGLDMAHLHHGGMAKAEEKKLIAQSLKLLQPYGEIRGWLSPARSQSENTLALLAQAGFDYCLDWVNDDMPYTMLENRLVAMPHSEELCDRQIILDYRHTEDSFVQQVQDAALCLEREAGRYGGRILALSLYPWVSGLPYRIKYLAQLIESIRNNKNFLLATQAQVLDAWRQVS